MYDDVESAKVDDAVVAGNPNAASLVISRKLQTNQTISVVHSVERTAAGPGALCPFLFLSTHVLELCTHVPPSKIRVPAPTGPDGPIDPAKP